MITKVFLRNKLILLTITTMVIPGHSLFKVLSNTCIVSSLKDVWSMTDKKVSFLLMCVDSYRMLVQGFINIW